MASAALIFICRDSIGGGHRAGARRTLTGGGHSGSREALSGMHKMPNARHGFRARGTQVGYGRLAMWGRRARARPEIAAAPRVTTWRRLVAEMKFPQDGR